MNKWKVNIALMFILTGQDQCHTMSHNVTINVACELGQRKALSVASPNFLPSIVHWHVNACPFTAFKMHWWQYVRSNTWTLWSHSIFCPISTHARLLDIMTLSMFATSFLRTIDSWRLPKTSISNYILNASNPCYLWILQRQALILHYCVCIW